VPLDLVLRRLDHPHVLPILGHDSDVGWLAMRDLAQLRSRSGSALPPPVWTHSSEDSNLSPILRI
jgi:hypothetical protein